MADLSGRGAASAHLENLPVQLESAVRFAIAELAAAILKSTAAARVYEGPSIHERVPKILSERGLGVPKIPGSPKIYDTGSWIC